MTILRDEKLRKGELVWLWRIRKENSQKSSEVGRCISRQRRSRNARGFVAYGFSRGWARTTCWGTWR